MILRDANSLKRDYTVFASFYKINASEKEFICRNVCDIKRNKMNEKDKLDAYLILMNPGSCHPTDTNYSIAEYDKWEHVAINMVECVPDQAQYQVMKLMDNKNWNYIRLINLSDVVMGNSKEFVDLLQTIPSDEHSIFSDRRIEN